MGKDSSPATAVTTPKLRSEAKAGLHLPFGRLKRTFKKLVGCKRVSKVALCRVAGSIEFLALRFMRKGADQARDSERFRDKKNCFIMKPVHLELVAREDPDLARAFGYTPETIRSNA